MAVERGQDAEIVRDSERILDVAGSDVYESPSRIQLELVPVNSGPLVWIWQLDRKKSPLGEPILLVLSVQVTSLNNLRNPRRYRSRSEATPIADNL
jgi:hypothetical protein